MDQDSLTNSCVAYLGLRDPGQLRRLDHAKFDKLRQFFRAVKVIVTIGSRTTRPRPIRDLVQNVADVQFDQDGVPTTVGVGH